MRGITMTTLIATALILAACNKHTHEKESGSAADSGKPAADVRSGAADGGRTVGEAGHEKWHADAPTNGGIAKLQEMVDAFDPVAGVEALKGPLEKEFSLILERCTMRGEAHDQLHNYLLPLKARIDALDNGNPDSTLSELESYLSSYWDRFRR